MLMLVVAYILIAHCTGCLTDQQKKDVAFDVYLAQQQACVDQYADVKSIDKCRDRVKAAWLLDHVQKQDAGADAGQEAGK